MHSYYRLSKSHIRPSIRDFAPVNWTLLSYILTIISLPKTLGAISSGFMNIILFSSLINSHFILSKVSFNFFTKHSLLSIVIILVFFLYENKILILIKMTPTAINIKSFFESTKVSKINISGIITTIY